MRAKIRDSLVANIVIRLVFNLFHHNDGKIIFGILQIILGLIVLSCVVISQDGLGFYLYKAFDFNESESVTVGILIHFLYILNPYLYVCSFLFTTLSRYLEFKADAFVVRLGLGKNLSNALIKLAVYRIEENLMFPSVDWLVSKFEYDCPPFLERLEKLSD